MVWSAEKNGWHWKCKVWNHKYFIHLFWAGKTMEYDNCTRCGFDPKAKR